MRRLILAFLMLFSTPFVLAADVSDGVDKVEKYWQYQAKVFSDWFRHDYEADLLESGLSKSDVDEILANLVERYVACFKAYLVRYADERSVELADLIKDDGMNLASSDAWWSTVLSESTRACQLTALENAGIQREYDAS